MSLERGSGREFFREELKKVNLEPGKIIDVPDVLFLDEVAKDIKGRIVSKYPQRELSTTKPLPLEKRFKDGTPENFFGSLINTKVIIESPDLSFIEKMNDPDTVDPDSVIQFTVHADGHSSAGGTLGNYERRFVALARKTDEGPSVSLLSGKTSGSLLENVDVAYEVSVRRAEKSAGGKIKGDINKTVEKANRVNRRLRKET